MKKIQACAARFRALAKDDPELRLLGGSRRPKLRVLDQQSYRRLYDVPNMEAIPFATRALIEGLIAHAILQPGQVVALWAALQTFAAVPAFKNRILESIYQEERIRDPQALVRGV